MTSAMRPPAHPFLSSVEGIDWPPVMNSKVAPLAALVSYLDASQWLPAEELHSRALRQLVTAASHWLRESPLFAERMRLAGLAAEDLGEPGGLHKLPPMTRRQAQEAGERLFCRQVPPEHKPLQDSVTSGSTGEPLKLRRTAISRLLWQANTIRDHLWHRRDFAGRLMSIRVRMTKVTEQETWGTPANLLFRTGGALGLPIGTPLPEQAARLRAFAPQSLLTYATNLAALIDELEKTGGAPSGLDHIRTVEEAVGPALRERVKEFFGLPIEDVYSSADAGVIAVQCPDCGRYHVMAETLIAEVVDDAGRHCGPGEIGRLLLTDYTNLSAPIIRYQLGDYAEMGEAAACGRGLPTLNRIMGRERNLMVMPDGTRRWPLLGFHRYRDVAPVRQYQFIQPDRGRIDMNLVVERPLSRDEEGALRRIVLGALGAPFDLRLNYHDGPLPRPVTGKFEEFICRVSG